MGYIHHAEALAGQDMLGFAGVRLNTAPDGERWQYHMIDPELAINLGEQLIREGQNAITTNRHIADRSYLDVMRERRRVATERNETAPDDD